LKDIIDVIVIDDASTDNTYQHLIGLADGDDIRISRNETNVGLTGNILNCFNECKTEYLIYMADDEILYKDGIEELIILLEDLKPDFLTTQWDRLDHIARESKKVKEISLLDIEAFAYHGPGLVFKKSYIDFTKPYLLSRLEKGCTAAFFLPLIILLIVGKLNDSKFFSSPILLGGFPKEGVLASNVLDSKGEHYLSLTNLLNRYIDLEKFYKEMLVEFSSSKYLRELKLLLDSHKLSLYFLLEMGIGLKSPKLIPDFRLGALRASMHPLGAIKNLINYISMKLKLFIYRIQN
tara:strand:+ start:442 stop:1320 length:879 start_codon:yes stop_codon:yes gene_type:complete